jgi:hypothetical protein
MVITYYFIQTLKKTESAIKNGLARDSGKIGHTNHKTKTYKTNTQRKQTKQNKQNKAQHRKLKR